MEELNIKVLAINLGGDKGKTTLMANMFLANLPNAAFIEVESVNSGAKDLGVTVVSFKGRQFKYIYNEIVASDCAIIDVGASNCEAFLDGLTKFEDGHDEIDLFVIPTTPGQKCDIDTIKTVRMLASLGVPAEKIRIIFNRVQESVTDEFPVILKFSELDKQCIADANAVVFESEIFDLLSKRKITVAKALKDTTDYKAATRAARAAGDEHAETRALDDLAIQKQAKSTARHLRRVFDIVTADIRA
jgi:hypothetical protein